MGEPVKIVDLARQMIELSGLRPDEDIEIVFTGLRPGEKLFEELSHKGENITPTNHPKIMRFVSEPLPLKEVRAHLTQLTEQMHEGRGESTQTAPETGRARVSAVLDVRFSFRAHRPLTNFEAALWRLFCS